MRIPCRLLCLCPLAVIIILLLLFCECWTRGFDFRCVQWMCDPHLLLQKFALTRIRTPFTSHTFILLSQSLVWTVNGYNVSPEGTQTLVPPLPLLLLPLFFHWHLLPCFLSRGLLELADGYQAVTIVLFAADSRGRKFLESRCIT
jgi:hypothetical protein